MLFMTTHVIPEDKLFILTSVFAKLEYLILLEGVINIEEHKCTNSRYRQRRE